MSDTAAQLATLKDMHAKGVLNLSQGGESVGFASGKELRARIAYLERQLAAETTGKGAGGITYPTYTKGL